MSAMRKWIRRTLGKEADHYDWPNDPRPAIRLIIDRPVTVDEALEAEESVAGLYPKKQEATPVSEAREQVIRERLNDVVMADAMEVVQTDYLGQPHYALRIKDQPTAILAVFPFSTRGQAMATFVLNAADDLVYLLSRTDEQTEDSSRPAESED